MRKRARRALERYFAKRSAPRSILSLLLILTGFAGLVVSFALLQAGLFAMWIRYPIAVLAGYGVFIGLLRLWLEFERSRFNPRPGEIEGRCRSRRKPPIQLHTTHALAIAAGLTFSICPAPSTRTKDA